MSTRIQKWGNSLAVRLPKRVAEQLGLSSGSVVDIKPEKNDLRIIPQKKRTPPLSELVRGITQENRHNETSWGRSVGNEV